MEDVRREELVKLIEANPEKAMALIAYETLLVLDQIADSIKWIRVSRTGHLPAAGDPDNLDDLQKLSMIHVRAR